MKITRHTCNVCISHLVLLVSMNQFQISGVDWKVADALMAIISVGNEHIYDI
jgi:hypothetical protein